MLLYAVSGDDHGETSGAPIVGSDGCSSGSYLKQLFPRYLRYRDNSIASQIAIYTIRWLQTTIDTMISFVFRLDLSKVFSEQFDIMWYVISYVLSPINIMVF
jgi:hypothetical protein